MAKKLWRITTLDFPDELDAVAFITADSVVMDQSDTNRSTAVIADGVHIEFQLCIYAIDEMMRNADGSCQCLTDNEQNLTIK